MGELSLSSRLPCRDSPMSLTPRMLRIVSAFAKSMTNGRNIAIVMAVVILKTSEYTKADRYGLEKYV